MSTDGAKQHPNSEGLSERMATDRHMNDTTLPTCSKIKASGTNSIDRKDGTIARIPRAKVPPKVKKGFALHDWINLVKHAEDLARRKGAPIRSIPKSEIALHNDVHDGWISLRGKVYNLTPYLHYHPGGIEIFDHVLGKDATVLFDKYHRWVNIDG